MMVSDAKNSDSQQVDLLMSILPAVTSSSPINLADRHPGAASSSSSSGANESQRADLQLLQLLWKRSKFDKALFLASVDSLSKLNVFDSPIIDALLEKSGLSGVQQPPHSLALVPLQSTPGTRYTSDFQEIAKMGSGAFGSVYEVFHRMTHRSFAVKKVNIRRGKLEEFLREVRGLALLEHKHICRYYNCWIEEGSAEDEMLSFEDDSYDLSCSEEQQDNKLTLYIQMELCSPLTLRDYIDNRKSVDYDEAKLFSRQIIKALAYIHKHNWLHRDIKPSNIFMTAEGPLGVKLGDFSLCKRFVDVSEDFNQDVFEEIDDSEIIDAEDESEVSSEALPLSKFSAAGGSMHTSDVGSPGYTAPEVLGSSAASNAQSVYSFKCDIFSLGVTLFELFNGRFHTRMERAMTLNDFIEDGQVPSALLSREPAVAGLLLTMVSEKPSQRPDAEQLLFPPSPFAKTPQCHMLVQSLEQMVKRLSEENAHLKRQLESRADADTL